MSSGRLPDVIETNKMCTGKESVSVPNKSESVFDKSLSNKPISRKSNANPSEIQDALKNHIISILIVFWNSNSISTLTFKISGDCLETNWIKKSLNQHCWTSKAIKTKF